MKRGDSIQAQLACHNSPAPHGPWFAGTEAHFNEKLGTYTIPISANGRAIASVYAGFGDGFQTAAQIAAVPDLLEACEQAEHWLSQSDRSIDPEEMLRVLRAAIAKAQSTTRDQVQTGNR